MFYYHVNQLCQKASEKLRALGKLAKYIDITKQRMLTKAFASSQFSYCPLIMDVDQKDLQLLATVIFK